MLPGKRTYDISAVNVPADGGELGLKHAENALQNVESIKLEDDPKFAFETVKVGSFIVSDLTRVFIPPQIETSRLGCMVAINKIYSSYNPL